MEGGDQHHYELRSRSRSRSHTPMVGQNQTRNDRESSVDHHYDLRHRSRDRSHTPGEVTSSRRSGTRSLPGSASKQRDKSMDPIAEVKDSAKSEAATNDETRREDRASSGVSKKVERRSERQRVKRQIFSNGQSETKDDSSEGKVEQKRRSLTPRITVTSDYSSEEGEKEDPPSRPGSAYEIYKQAGEWWNVFPKTDYTYSQKSSFRYEIAPGVLAMPNMSRPSIHSDGNSTSGSVNSLSQQNLSQCSRGTRGSYGDSLDHLDSDARETIEQNRLNEMNTCRLFARMTKEDSAGRSIVYKKTHIEQYNRHREIVYGGSSDSIRHKRRGDLSQVDSDTDLDDATSLQNSRQQQKWRIGEFFETVRFTIEMWMSSCWEFVNVNVLRRKHASASHSYQRYTESKWKKFWAPIDRVMQYLYLMLVRILFLDTWLLSRATTARQQLKQRRSKLIWLILLPPLLLAGAYIAQKHSLASVENLQNIQNALTKTTNRIYNDAANIKFFDYGQIASYIAHNFQKISLPSLPSMNVSVPWLKDIGWNVTG